MKKVKSNSLAASVVLVALTFVTAVSAGQALKIDDHSFPKAHVRTFHVSCTQGRFATIRLDPDDDQLCGAVQDGSKPRLCIVRPAAEPAQAVRQLAVQLCQ